jgi:hypothetical protein
MQAIAVVRPGDGGPAGRWRSGRAMAVRPGDGGPAGRWRSSERARQRAGRRRASGENLPLGDRDGDRTCTDIGAGARIT